MIAQTYICSHAYVRALGVHTIKTTYINNNELLYTLVEHIEHVNCSIIIIIIIMFVGHICMHYVYYYVWWTCALFLTIIIMYGDLKTLWQRLVMGTNKSCRDIIICSMKVQQNSHDRTTAISRNIATRGILQGGREATIEAGKSELVRATQGKTHLINVTTMCSNLATQFYSVTVTQNYITVKLL